MTPEEFKKEAKEYLAKYIIDGTDTSKNKISFIFSRNNEYVIYEIITQNQKKALRVAISPLTKNDDNNIESNFIKVRAKYVETKSLLYKCNGNKMVGRIAQVLAHGIDGNIKESNDGFDAIIIEINKNYKEQFKNRLRYITIVLSIVAFCTFLSIMCYNCNWFSKKPLNQLFIYVSTAGSIGGFISVSRRIRQMVFEQEVSSYLYIFYGLERSVISIFGAIIVFFVIKSNILLGFVNELGEKSIYGVLLFAFVAGFSETLIPNILINLEKENT